MNSKIEFRKDGAELTVWLDDDEVFRTAVRLPKKVDSMSSDEIADCVNVLLAGVRVSRLEENK